VRRCNSEKGPTDLEHGMSFCLDLMIKKIPRFGRSGE
jgi:hypothetical protein